MEIVCAISIVLASGGYWSPQAKGEVVGYEPNSRLLTIDFQKWMQANSVNLEKNTSVKRMLDNNCIYLFSPFKLVDEFVLKNVKYLEDVQAEKSLNTNGGREND